MDDPRAPWETIILSRLDIGLCAYYFWEIDGLGRRPRIMGVVKAVALWRPFLALIDQCSSAARQSNTRIHDLMLITTNDTIY